MKVRLVGGNRVRVRPDDTDMMGVQVELEDEDGELMRLVIFGRSMGDYVTVQVDGYGGPEHKAHFSWLPIEHGDRGDD